MTSARISVLDLPALPAHVKWCLPLRRKLRWARIVHIAHRSTLVTLCGRVRPGDEVSTLEPELEYCPRCLYRAAGLWVLG